MTKEIINLNGYETYLYKWEVKNPKYVMQLVHGSKEHATRYDEMASYLNSKGIEVWSFDLRGHGEKAPKLGHIDSSKQVLRDVHIVSKMIRKEYPEATYVLYGHSMGSFIARTYAQIYGEADKFIFSGTTQKNLAFLYTSLGMAKVMKLFKGKAKYSPFLDKQSYDVFAKKFKNQSGTWVTSDETKSEEAKNDKFFGHPFTTESFIAMFDWMIHMVKTTNIQSHPVKPTLFSVGTEDVINNKGKEVSKAYSKYKRLGKDVHIKFFKGMRHETHNEVNRKEVYEFYANFVLGDK